MYLNHSMFKHYTYFAETANLIAASGYKVSVLDCGVELYDRRTIYYRFKQSNIIIFLIEPYTIKTTMSLAKIAKEMSPDCKVILYGTAAALIPNYLSRNDSVDYVIADGFFYEGIMMALYLIKNRELVYQDKLSKILYGNTAKTKTWGNPISDIIPLDRYRKYGNGMFEFTVQTGCPYNCSFCSEKILFSNRCKCRFEQRPVDNIISILDEAKMNFTSAYFSATTFTYDREWVLNICKAITREKIQISWRSDTRIDCLDRELIREMKRAGLNQLSIGIESFEDRLLQEVRKGVHAKIYEEKIRLCQAEGVTIKALLILGIPGQTSNDVLHTQKMVQKLGIPYRWKEYSPIRELHEEDNNNLDIEKYINYFDRTGFSSSSVIGLSTTEYMQLLFPDNYNR